MGKNERHSQLPTEGEGIAFPRVLLMIEQVDSLSIDSARVQHKGCYLLDPPGMVRYSTVWYGIGMVRYSTVWYGMVWYWYGKV